MQLDTLHLIALPRFHEGNLQFGFNQARKRENLNLDLEEGALKRRHVMECQKAFAVWFSQASQIANLGATPVPLSVQAFRIAGPKPLVLYFHTHQEHD